MPGGMPGIFACLLKIAVAWLLLFCSLLGCLLDCLLSRLLCRSFLCRCLLGGSLFCCFLNCQFLTSFCGFAGALTCRGLFRRSLSALCASGFWGGLLCGLFGRSFFCSFLGGLLSCLFGRFFRCFLGWGFFRRSLLGRSFLCGLLAGRLCHWLWFHDNHALFDNNIVVVG